jgi:hypothetical protein
MPERRGSIWLRGKAELSGADDHDIEDIQACAREGRVPRAVGPYRILVGDALLTYHPIVVAESVLTGRALLGLAPFRPVEDHALFAVLIDGLLEEIRLEETIDLRAGVERFLAFKSDRIYRFLLDGREFHWGGRFISGSTVLGLAKADSQMYGLWIKGADGAERAVGLKELVDLDQPGVESFTTRRLDA